MTADGFALIVTYYLSMEESPRPELQRDVQRLLGRCFLRLQQYEKLLKALIVDHVLAGPAHELEVIRSKRIDDLAKKSLGQLFEKFFESYVVIDGQGEEKDVLAGAGPTVINLAFKFSMSVTLERRDAMQAAVAELVNLRNGLAHHFIDLFDVWTDDGCIRACEYLVRSYDSIDAHYEELRGWARSMQEARELSVAFMQSQTFRDSLVDGIFPDGVVDWQSAGCVRALRESLEHLTQVDGWVRLPEAVAWLEAHHRDQSPARYGCRSWQHVLHESKQFDLQYRLEDVAGQAKVAWFKGRSTKSTIGR